MEAKRVLQKSVKDIALGTIGFFCSTICIMGYYPVIPAFFAANCLLGEGSLFLYVGILAGMGYFLPLSAMVKYAASLIVIAVAIRFYLWANRKCGGMAAGIISGLILSVMNLSGHLFSMVSGREILLGISEGAMVLGLTALFHYIFGIMPELFRNIGRKQEQEEESAQPLGWQEEKVAAFTSAVDGLSSAFMSMQRTKEKAAAENVGLLEQEITGKLCAACDGCAVCWNEQKNDLSERIRLMLQAVMAHYPREEIIRRVYVSTCPRYPNMVEEAIAAFGRMELNRAWYRRLLDNRIAIAAQLDAIAGIMTQWSREDRNIDSSSKLLLSKIAYEVRERGLVAEDVHIYEDVNSRRYIRANVYSKWSGGIPSKNYVKALEKAVGKPLRLENEARSILTKEPARLTVYEDTVFYTMTGISSKKKNGSMTSGDSFTMFAMEDGRYFLCLSDGMGSGERAGQESEMVVDLFQKFMEAGFEKEIAIRMMNSAMVLQGEDNSYSTLDMAELDLYSGELMLYKIGAAASFLKRGDETECIDAGSLPAGAELEPEPGIAQRAMENGDFLVMVSDGVLEYLHVKDPQQKFGEILSDIQTDNANVLAQKALERVLLFTGGYAMDDMTIMVTAVWEK